MNEEVKMIENNRGTSHWNDADLPDLSDEDLFKAERYSSRLWALDFVNPENVGKYEFMSEFGLTLQNTGQFAVRCIYAIDHYEVRITLAMLRKTFASINIKLELGQHTIVAPFSDNLSDNKPTIGQKDTVEKDIIQKDIVQKDTVQGRYDFIDIV